ncbi:MAG: GGDEF domain-containing protein [Bdellovibrionaceae bacterium]|nr:GGDEF domain-containing protein [Pseudobdellovibrionaceae bacterium]MBX3034814.1 GGDEF domain-containing protein [Pseudobdellovibrionaceae bacterium]
MSNNQDDTNNIGDKTVVASGDTLKKSMPATDSAPPVVVVLLGPTAYQGQQFALQSGAVIGRAHESEIYIDDRSLSRSHARIDIKGSEVTVVDLGSTNKTVVNGQVLAPMAPCHLKNNDQIKAGNIIFKFLERGSIEAVTNQQLFEKANRDALTGAYSKGALIARAPEAIKRSETVNEALSVIVFDIDHFKKVNDVYGHPGGDHVLRELGRIVGSNLVRGSDFFARYGGEEFVLILAATPSKTAAEIAERIRQTIQTTEFVFEGKRIPVTVSLGVATRLPTETEWSVLFDRADKALYQSKQNGRNKVTVV